MRSKQGSVEVVREKLIAYEVAKEELVLQIATLQHEHDTLCANARPLVTRCDQIRKEIKALEKDPKNRRMWTSWNGVLTAKAKERKEHLENEHSRLESQLRDLQQTTSQPNAGIPQIGFNGSIFTSFSRQIYDVERRLEHLVRVTIPSQLQTLNEALLHDEREARKQAKAAQRNKKRAIEKALLSQAKGRSRDLADTVKKHLHKTERCPYCGECLGAQPHADHIYPQSKGGLSVAANMVYVCVTCNSKKADLTLTVFIERFSLDRAFIEERLRELGKEF
jgi:hypothetical protein